MPKYIYTYSLVNKVTTVSKIWCASVLTVNRVLVTSLAVTYFSSLTVAAIEWSIVQPVDNLESLRQGPRSSSTSQPVVRCSTVGDRAFAALCAWNSLTHYTNCRLFITLRNIKSLICSKSHLHNMTFLMSSTLEAASVAYRLSVN